MSELAVAASEAPVLSPVERVVNTFAAPAKTFQDVKRSSGWWVPFLIAVAIGVLYGYVMLHKVGLTTLTDGVIRQSKMMQDQIASATPEQAATIRAAIGTRMKYVFYSAPVVNLLLGMIVAGVLLATANFGAGGRSTFGQMMGVWYYGTLPMVFFYVLVMGAAYGGVLADQFDINNPIGTNVGFYLTGGEVPKALLPLLTSLDLFAIWAAWLLTVGVSTVAGIKRGAAAAVVFGWWVLIVLLKTAGAAFAG